MELIISSIFLMLFHLRLAYIFLWYIINIIGLIERMRQMCGIVGYVGSKKASDVLIDGLKRLEYRGYDSCGLATIDAGNLKVIKSINRMDSLKQEAHELEGFIGIGHTRWATHGIVSIANAHPHVSQDGKIAVVHNGIIENYTKIKEMLKEKGYSFYSETDTEVIPNLISFYYEGNLLKAVKRATDELSGSYAIAVMCVEQPDILVVTKNDNPLVIGRGKGENYIASDFGAILKGTNDVAILENRDFAIISKDDIQFYSKGLEQIEYSFIKLDTNPDDLEKNGFSHFMLKEIHEQPITVQKLVEDYIDGDNIEMNLKLTKQQLRRINRMHIVACGTAMHAGLYAKYMIERLVRIPVNVEVASEFRYKNPIIEKDDLVLFISQSGETADTLASLELVKERNIPFISIVNVKESTMDRMSENVLYTKAGTEVAVASTKAYTAQLTLLGIFAIYMAQIQESYDEKELKYLIHEIKMLPSKIDRILDNEERAATYARAMIEDKSLFYVGRGLDYYVALEAALKLKEISYIHAEALPFGELKHGAIALIEKGTDVIVFANSLELWEKTLSNIKEIEARGAKVYIETTIREDIPEFDNYDTLVLPEVHELLSPILSIIPQQLFSYNIACMKNLDVDKPRNLAKSVTVE